MKDYVNSDKIVSIVLEDDPGAPKYVNYLAPEIVSKHPTFWGRLIGKKPVTVSLPAGIEDYGTEYRLQEGQTIEELLEAVGYGRSIKFDDNSYPKLTYKHSFTITINFVNKTTNRIFFDSVEEMEQFLESTFDLSKLTLVKK